VGFRWQCASATTTTTARAYHHSSTSSSSAAAAAANDHLYLQPTSATSYIDIEPTALFNDFFFVVCSSFVQQQFSSIHGLCHSVWSSPADGKLKRRQY
jgi:hypothetical protein